MPILCSSGEIDRVELFFEIVQDILQDVDERIGAQADDSHPELKAALEHLLASGGKRMRPTLVLLVGKMFNGDRGQLITLGASVELLHTATLVHDDLIDGSLLRRGNPTLNARWSPAATVLTGDFLFARAARLASELESPSALKIFADTLATIVEGEMTQLFTSRGQANRQNYYQRIYAKTASLFETSAWISATLSGAEEAQQKSMKQFGYELGMAFQIVDDILDFTGEQITVGKPVASDLRQGLVTLPAIYFIEANPHNEDMIKALKMTCDHHCIERLIKAIRESGAVAQAAEEARGYIQRAIKSLDGMPVCPQKDALIQMAEYIINRKL